MNLPARTISLSMLLSVSVALLVLLNIVEAQNGSSRLVEIFPPDSHPYNLTYGEWSAKWWQWGISIPLDKSPFDDPTGERCGTSQNDSNMWFLAGTYGGDAVRTCEIPAGRAVIFSPITVRCDFIVDKVSKTEADLRKCAKDDQDTVNVLNVSIDGKPVDNLKLFRMQSPLFDVTFPANNVAGVPPGTTQAVSDGWFIILKPMPIGQHQIRSYGASIDPTGSGKINFATSFTFKINVK